MILAIGSSVSSFSTPDGSISVDDLRKAYNRSRVNNGRPPLSDSNLGREMSRLFPKLKRVRIGNPRNWHYQGVRRGTKYSLMGND